MNYSYEAFDKNGAQVSGILEADSEIEARDQARQKGLYVTSVKQAGADRSSLQTKRVSSAGASASLTNLAVMTRQLSVLVSSGTPVVDAIAALEKQSKDQKWTAVIRDVRTRVEQGEPLSQAMSAHPRVFNTVCRSLVAAGEASGQLPEMLDRLATLIRRQQHVRKSVTGALVYPTLLISVSVGVLIMMIMFVMPRFAGMFESLNAELPVTTKYLMQLSGFLRGYWWAVLTAIAGAGFGAVAWLRTQPGKDAIDVVSLRAPLVGSIFQSFITARLMRVLGALLESRIPMLEAIELTRETVPNKLYKSLMIDVEDAVIQGDSITRVLDESPLIDDAICEAVRSGEKSGNIGPVLSSMAGFMDEDNEVLVRSLTSILEPVILIVLGVVVAIVAISMFLPMFDLVASAPGGS